MMGWLPVPDPVAFSVFGLEIRWYAICLTTGMLVVVWLCSVRAPKKALLKDRLLDLFICCAPAGVIGARIYYVIFKWDYYSLNLKEILNFREGITKIMMCGLLLIMIALAVRSVTLPGAEKGLDFYLKPSFNNLVANGLWNSIYATMGQAFFTDRKRHV